MSKAATTTMPVSYTHLDVYKRQNPRRVANLVQSELTMRLKAAGLELEQSPISMQGVAQAADLSEDGKLSSKQLKQLFDLSFERNEDFLSLIHIWSPRFNSPKTMVLPAAPRPRRPRTRLSLIHI